MEKNISPDEQAYHQTVLAQLRASQAVLDSWMRHLSMKYKLSAVDRIDEQGNILRPEPPKPPAPEELKKEGVPEGAIPPEASRSA